ncbi:uncharacterized protein (DUF58 family) [Paenibacillus phyllosphaerae]|uniref:Uncharacterized protein (DUF58 family) n=1 Tax=Paenibacillus phyllosphaerae TaxID=274593 RepID=A0A7W5AUD2_9BACL|nr:DUF58 domain-containing protein [Paenibacillus phyllosphaerae]MBB3108933.1 uncharacterized protein (DUF58 family) [Paenibacillus phyllosphaerae]
MLFGIFNVLLIYLLLGRFSGISRVKGARRLSFGNQAAAGEKVLTAGTRLDVQLSVHIPGFWPAPYVLVRDRIVRQNGTELAFESSFVPNYKRSGEVSYTTPGLTRGIYRFAPTACSTCDIFGLFEHTGSFESGEAFSVYPQTVPIRHWAQLRHGAKGPYSTSASQRAAKETTQINGVREYIYGDRLSRIHWNATAKTGQWKSKEFERESLPRTMLILDRYGGAYETGEHFELAVSAVASIAQFSFRSSTSIGLLSAGQTKEGMAAKASPDQLELMMNHFVRVQPDGAVPIYRTLRQSDAMLPYGSFAVLVTPQGGEETVRTMEWLSKRGIVPLLVHIRSQASAGRAQDDWQRLLRKGGFSVHSISTLQELPAVLEGGGAS